jgi:hypothetical protein
MVAVRRDDETNPASLQPGEVCRYKGQWYAQTPLDESGRTFLANLSAHTVAIESDGAITVVPSIRVYQSSVGSWHGFLEHGKWRVA